MNHEPDHVDNHTEDQQAIAATEAEAVEMVSATNTFVGPGDSWSIFRASVDSGASSCVHNSTGPL